MKRLVVLRPEPGASETMERATELGLNPVSIPLFAVEPIAWEVPDAGSFDALLLTSANALRHGGEQLRKLRGLRAYCVGQATATAARKEGFDIAAVGTSGAQRLLDSLEPGLKLLHPAGEDRIHLNASKQQVCSFAVYRAAELPVPARLREAEGAVVLVHSPRAGRRFADLAEKIGLDRTRVCIAGISKAAVEGAGSGWQDAAAADAPDEASLLALAQRMCNNPGAR